MLMEIQGRLCLIVTVIIICCGLTCGQNSRPNIIFVLADDLGWDDVGFHGSRQIPTPNLDALAYDGIILANYYVQPLCTPSRAALMTGRYPIHYGLQHSVIYAPEPYGLPLNETIFPQYLKHFGYATHIVGKWHLGFFTEDYTPNRRGFDSFYGYYTGREDYFDHTCSVRYPNPIGWGYDFRRNAELEKATFGQYSTELFTREAEKIIANHNTSQPLFMYLSHQAVHRGNLNAPLEAPAKYVHKVSHIKTKTRQLYAAMMSALDDSVGNVTRALHQRGMLNNTIIIFSTDNGGPADGFDFNDASNWPLRGLKSTLWEGGVRGAGFIWSPLLRRSRYTSHHLMHITDWLPTLMHAVTADSDSFSLPQNLDGLDQWDALSDDLKSRRSEILHNIDPKEDAAALRVGDMKLVSASNGTTCSCDGWYPSDGHHGNTCRNGTLVNDQFMQTFYQIGTADKVNMTIVRDKYQPETFHFINNSRPKFPNNGKIRPPYLSEVAPTWHSELISILEEIGRKPVYPEEPLSVKCGPRPENASTNCKPCLQACLFNVTADPCEYENLALSQPHVVAALQKRLEFYKERAVPPVNKPVDYFGLPYFHNGYWVPWKKAVSSSQREDGK